MILAIVRVHSKSVVLTAMLVGCLFSFDDKPALAQTAYAVTVLEQTWRDHARQRELPVKLRLPSPRQSTERLPVILFSHGLGGSRDGGAKWGEFWSTHGYVVVHIQHPGSDENIIDARHSLSQNLHALRRAGNAQQLRDRLSDIKFILDELHHRAEFHQADLTRIGMSGHSFGALTTQMLAGQSKGAKTRKNSDPRIKAVIAFSPSVRNRVDAETQFTDVKLPFMSVTGTLDGDIYGLGIAPEERIRPFYAMPSGHKFLLLFHHGDHAVFSGGSSINTHARLPEAVAEDERITRQTQMLTLAFWDAYLRNMAPAQQWLTTRAASTLEPLDRFEQR
jgi:predicted dienelactone hydrolase